MDGKKILEEARALRGWLCEIRRDFHRNPELSGEEGRTADEIERLLGQLGAETRRNGTAVLGLIRGARPGNVVALRADIDALPLREETGAPYASIREGVMHACGHDAHAAIQLGAARWFAERTAEFSGAVKLLFQPAEETVGGAEPMIRDGCLEDPRVDYVLGLHVMPNVEVGSVELKKGALNGSSTTLKAVLRGKSAHAAYPETGIDAVLIAAHAVTGLHALVSRYVSPLESAVLTVGTISGGTRTNILAEEVVLGATLRTTDDRIRDLLVERARAVVEGVAASFGGSGSLEVQYGYAALINRDECVDVVAEAASEVLGPGRIVWKEKPSMGVEDFSFFLRERPGAFYHLGCGNPARGISAPLHSPAFDLDEECLPVGVAVQVAATLRLLSGPAPEPKAG